MGYSLASPPVQAPVVWVGLFKYVVKHCNVLAERTSGTDKPENGLAVHETILLSTLYLGECRTKIGCVDDKFHD
jgi:hypothetical protein